MYQSHPSDRLSAAFRRRPFQGAVPEEAEIVFIGLDANYAADVELTSSFPSILDYHDDGVAFWHRHGVHHPFLLPGYRGSGKPYHRNFARIGFTPEGASRVSFIELLHLATIGVNQKLDVGDFDAVHLARIDRLVTAGAARLVFASDKVLRLMRATRRFSWLTDRVDRSGELPVVHRHGDTTVHLHLHFSNYGKFQEQMVREAQAMRVLCGAGAGGVK
jgi:hypothetical protein